MEGGWESASKKEQKGKTENQQPPGKILGKREKAWKIHASFKKGVKVEKKGKNR